MSLWDEVSKDTGIERINCKYLFYKAVYGFIPIDGNAARVFNSVAKFSFRNGGVASLVSPQKRKKPNDSVRSVRSG
jgi:hypothetical protein